MTLTANEIIRIMKIARYKACREKMGFKNEPWEKYLKSIELFKMYHNNVNISDLNIHNSELNISELLQFLIRDCFKFTLFLY